MWQNNKFNLRINNELPKDFSLEDIDGVIRFHYMENGTLYTRLILYEVKSFGEKEIQPAQRKTLNLLQQSIDWTKFDDMSGVFLIKALDENFERSEKGNRRYFKGF